MTSKLVDGNYLSKLLGGSFETIMGQVDEAVAAKPDLFGGGDGGEVRTIGTFPNHAIVLNDSGEFFRTSFVVSEDTGGIVLGEVERIDVPVREASELSGEVRTESRLAVEALLGGDDDEADNRLGSLYEMVRSGVRLTAEGVEDFMLSLEQEPEWIVAVQDNESSMAQFVGAEANKDLPRPKFETFIAEGKNSDDRHRKVIAMSFKQLQESLGRMKNGIAVARRIDGEYRLPTGDETDAMVVSEDFLAFVSEYGIDLDATIGLVEDAISVCEDGTLKSLARVHDRVAARVKYMSLAAEFSEKFARRFDQPHDRAGREVEGNVQ